MHALITFIQWSGMVSGWILWALCLLLVRPKGHKRRQVAQQGQGGILAGLDALNAPTAHTRPRPHRAGSGY